MAKAIVESQGLQYGIQDKGSDSAFGSLQRGSVNFQPTKNGLKLRKSELDFCTYGTNAPIAIGEGVIFNENLNRNEPCAIFINNNPVDAGKIFIKTPTVTDGWIQLKNFTHVTGQYAPFDKCSVTTNGLLFIPPSKECITIFEFDSEFRSSKLYNPSWDGLYIIKDSETSNHGHRIEFGSRHKPSNHEAQLKIAQIPSPISHIKASVLFDKPISALPVGDNYGLPIIQTGLFHNRIFLVTKKGIAFGSLAPGHETSFLSWRETEYTEITPFDIPCSPFGHHPVEVIGSEMFVRTMNGLIKITSGNQGLSLKTVNIVHTELTIESNLVSMNNRLYFMVDNQLNNWNPQSLTVDGTGNQSQIANEFRLDNIHDKEWVLRTRDNTIVCSIAPDNNEYNFTIDTNTLIGSWWKASGAGDNWSYQITNNFRFGVNVVRTQNNKLTPLKSIANIDEMGFDGATLIHNGDVIVAGQIGINIATKEIYPTGATVSGDTIMGYPIYGYAIFNAPRTAQPGYGTGMNPTKHQLFEVSRLHYLDITYTGQGAYISHNDGYIGSGYTLAHKDFLTYGWDSNRGHVFNINNFTPERLDENQKLDPLDMDNRVSRKMVRVHFQSDNPVNSKIIFHGALGFRTELNRLTATVRFSNSKPQGLQ